MSALLHVEGAMKLNENFIFHIMDGEAVVVPTAEAPFHGLI